MSEITEEFTGEQATATAEVIDAPPAPRKRVVRKRVKLDEQGAAEKQPEPQKASGPDKADVSDEAAAPKKATGTRKAAAPKKAAEPANTAESETAARSERAVRPERAATPKKAAEPEKASKPEKAAEPEKTVRSEKSADSANAGDSEKSVESKRTNAPRRTVRNVVAKTDADGSREEGSERGDERGHTDEEKAAPRPTRPRNGRQNGAYSDNAPQNGDRPQRSRNNNGGNQGNRPHQGKGNNGNNNGNNNNGNNNGNRNGRNRRSFGNQREVGPQITREELEGMKVAELRAKADEFEIEHKNLKKDELIDIVLAAMIRAEGFVECSGILDLLSDGYGFLRTHGYLPGEGDVYVGVSAIRKNGLRKGDFVTGMVRPPSGNDKFPALNRIDTVNGKPVEENRDRVRFADLTPVYPDERLVMEHGHNTITSRTIDLVAPIGKGQRGLIVSPPKAGKTTILKDIAASITANNPEVHLMCLLVDERPEEVTDMERSIHGEVVSSTFDMPSENHIAVAELVIERAKRLVEMGEDVVILLDSITRLARAYNLAQPASGRVLSGGVDSTALYPPKRFLGAARNIEHGGSLTILASALIDTGSKMDEVIFEEFKGTGNMELKLDRGLADRRIFPAIDPVASGTRKEELLLDPQEAPLIWGVRRVLANAGSTERAMEMLIKSLKQTDDNQTFIMRAARKAQERSGNGSFEL